MSINYPNFSLLLQLHIHEFLLKQNHFSLVGFYRTTSPAAFIIKNHSLFFVSRLCCNVFESRLICLDFIAQALISAQQSPHCSQSTGSTSVRLNVVGMREFC